MKKVLLFLMLMPVAVVFGQGGYEIKVTCKPFKNKYLFLGHYFGKQYPIVDSAMLDGNSQATFRGSKSLPGGIYLIGYPDKSGFFEILIDKQQKFTVIADTATLKNGVQFINSPDNTLFTSYQQYMAKTGKKVNENQIALSKAQTAADSAKYQSELERLDKEIVTYRNNIISKNPNNILTTLLICMREPVLTGKYKNPANKEDSLTAYNYYKAHYWDGVKFYDGRLAYTTFFEDKLDKYFNQLVVPQPDSVIKEIDHMLSFASANTEMNRFLLVKFINRYLVQKYMWEDAIFVHLFEKYFANTHYDWLTDKGLKTITDRAYSLMANIMGSPAADIQLPDTSNVEVSLYKLESPFTVVAFWDPTCSHCKEMMPRLDSFYQAKWKAEGLKIFALAKETEGTKKTWTDFIREHNLGEWTNVYYSKADEKARVDAGIPSYSQYYDVMTFPTIYLLDKDKRIIAKKLTLEQIDEVLALKIKGKQ
jgi:thiol-disulfide isomerase/thioredoxin